MTTEIKKRKSIIEEIKKIHKVNLNQNLTFMTRYENTINSIYNLFFFLTFTKDNHKPQSIKNYNNKNSKDNNINNGANQSNKLNLYFNLENPQNQITNANNNNSDNELNKLLTEERKKNKELINENTNLKNIIKNLKEELNKTKESQNSLENQLAKAKEELQKYQSKNYIQTGDSMMSIHPGDKILAINFVSMGSQDIGHFNLICKNTDLFVTLEARLYEVYPQFKDFDTYFEFNTKRIKRFKTVEENGIKSNDIISIFTIE